MYIHRLGEQYVLCATCYGSIQILQFKVACTELNYNILFFLHTFYKFHIFPGENSYVHLMLLYEILNVDIDSFIHRIYLIKIFNYCIQKKTRFVAYIGEFSFGVANSVHTSDMNSTS